MIKPRTLLVVLAILSLPTLALSEQTNWPQFRGPRGDGSTQGNVPIQWSESEDISWKTPIHGRGWSSPVIWGDQIWMGTATEDGTELFAVCVELSSGAIVHDIKLFDQNEPQEIHVFNSHASPTPAIESGRVYMHFGAYGTACLDTATGEKHWQRRDLPCNHFRGPGSSPILYGDLIIMHYDGFDYQYAIALNKHTGETVWKQDRSNDYRTENGDFKKAYCTPTVIQAAGKTQLISPGSKATFSYDPLTGDEYWRVEYDQFSGTARPLYVDGLVIVSTGFSKADMWAIRPDGAGNVTDTHVEWKIKRTVPSKPSFVAKDGLIFMVEDKGVASCVEAATGRHVWTERLESTYSASPLLAGDLVYFFDEEGQTTVIRASRDYDVVAENRLETGCMASPAVSGDSLILRTKTHLYRIEHEPRVSVQ